MIQYDTTQNRNATKSKSIEAGHQRVYTNSKPYPMSKSLTNGESY